MGTQFGSPFFCILGIYYSMNLKESIKRILREEIKMPLQLKRRVNNDVLDELIYTVKSLIDSGYDESDAIYDTVRQFIATKQFKLKNDSEQSYWDSYIEVEEPLVDYVKSKLNIQESVLREETNPTIRRIYRRADPDKVDKIFRDGLGTMTTRYIQNQHNWHAMNLDKFKTGIVSYVIVDLCVKYSDICYGAGDFYNQVWEFLLSHYSDVMEERWNEIMSGEINESIENGKKVYYGFQGLPNFWADDQDNFKGDKYFEDKDYEDYYFDNFYDMDVQFGNENSLFGTRGLPVGHPDRSSKSFNSYNEKYGPIIVRVVKEREGINESVIKENKVENLVKQYLSEFGLTKTSEMMGISLSEVVEIAKIPIDSDIANQILVEMMNKGKLKNKYKEFEIHSSSNNVFFWETMTNTGHFHDDVVENITVAATPFWDGVKYTPVELDWFTLFNEYGDIIYEISPEGGFYRELKHQTNFESVDELLNWYEEFYLPEVYNMVMNTLLPKMHKLVDYEIKQRG